MTTQNTNAVPAVSAEVKTIVAHEVDFKGTKFNLTRQETKGRGDKAAPVAFWGIANEQFALGKVGDKVNGVDITLDGNAKTEVDRLAGLIGWQVVRDMAFDRINNRLKACQTEQGKDTYTMEDKATYAKEYISNDWGVNSKVGGAFIKGLKELNTKQGDLLARLASLYAKRATATPVDAVELDKQIMATMAEVATLPK